MGSSFRTDYKHLDADSVSPLDHLLGHGSCFFATGNGEFVGGRAILLSATSASLSFLGMLAEKNYDGILTLFFGNI